MNLDEIDDLFRREMNRADLKNVGLQSKQKIWDRLHVGVQQSSKQKTSAQLMLLVLLLLSLGVIGFLWNNQSNLNAKHDELTQAHQLLMDQHGNLEIVYEQLQEKYLQQNNGHQDLPVAKIDTLFQKIVIRDTIWRSNSTSPDSVFINRVDTVYVPIDITRPQPNSFADFMQVDTDENKPKVSAVEFQFAESEEKTQQEIGRSINIYIRSSSNVVQPRPIRTSSFEPINKKIKK